MGSCSSVFGVSSPNEKACPCGGQKQVSLNIDFDNQMSFAIKNETDTLKIDAFDPVSPSRGSPKNKNYEKYFSQASDIKKTHTIGSQTEIKKMLDNIKTKTNREEENEDLDHASIKFERNSDKKIISLFN